MQPMKTSKGRWRIIGILCSILLFVFSTEFLFTAFDPLGINRYDDDLRLYSNSVIDNNGLVVLLDGEHRFSNWTATIAAGTRVTQTRSSDCDIAFIGDSVTFGWGVNDADVWVNLLAQTYPTVEIRNYAYPGYDTANLSAAFRQIRADGYVYFIIENDSGRGIQAGPRQSESRRWTLARYVLHLTFMYRAQQRQIIATDEFKAFLEGIPANTLMLGFTGEVLAGYAAEHHGAILVERYTEALSAGDGHANVVGNQQIYAAVLPHVDAFIRRICG
jgi:hypothetical protein